MKGFFKLERVIVLVTLLVACAPMNLFPSPTPTPTASQIPTQTSTPSPTPTETLTTTPTQTLTPEQQRERDYGALVPKDEPCVREPELHMNDPQYVSFDQVMAELSVYTTGNVKKEKTLLGKNGVEAEITMVQVVCRDVNGNLTKPMWLVIGSDSFGKNKSGNNIYWITIDNGTLVGITVTTIDEILKQISKGLEIRIDIPVKRGNANLVDRFWENGASNQLANEAIRRFEQSQEQIDLIVQGVGVSQDDFQLFPIRITLGPFNFP